MTESRGDHARFDELAAGYALGALEPHDQRQFLSHADHCERCGQALAGYAAVTAELAETVPPASPDPQLKTRILAAAASNPARDDCRPMASTPVAPGSDFVPEQAGPAASSDRAQSPMPEHAGPGGVRPAPVFARRPGPGTRRLRLAVAAAAVVAAGAGIWGGLAATSGRAPTTAGCVGAAQCTQVTLTAATGHQAVAGRVIVEGRTVWLRAAGLPADDPARQIYVLWQLTGKHTPLAVGSFDVRRGAHAAIRIGGLAAPYRGTLAFAVSLEHGRTIPASPSQPVALGQVPASPDHVTPRH